MSVADLLAEVEAWGGTVDLEAVEYKLVVDVPGEFPDSAIECLRANKRAIIQHLSPPGYADRYQASPGVVGQRVSVPRRVIGLGACRVQGRASGGSGPVWVAVILREGEPDDAARPSLPGPCQRTEAGRTPG